MTSTRTMADLRAGEHATIVAFAAAAGDATRLRHLGFRPGVRVTKKRVAPLGDPAVYEVLGYEMCLRKREARSVMVGDDP